MEQIRETERQIAELQKIVDAHPGTPKARNARRMIAEAREHIEMYREQELSIEDLDYEALYGPEEPLEDD